MAWVAGVDGCRGGWFVVLRDMSSGCTRHNFVEEIRGVLTLPEKPIVVAVDIPIGLLEHAVRGGRDCDREARGLLGEPRARSVFSPPVRAALSCADYPSACRTNRASSSEKIGISRQSFGLRDKLLELDELMSPGLQDTIKEVHPELSFYELNGRRAMKHSKKEHDGLANRRKLLLDVGFAGVVSGNSGYPRAQVAEDDVLDACVACWTATRILGGQAICIPTDTPCDGCGIRMEIWR